MSPFYGPTGTPCFRHWLPLPIGFKGRVDVLSPLHLCIIDPPSQLWPDRGRNHEFPTCRANVPSICPRFCHKLKICMGCNVMSKFVEPYTGQKIESHIHLSLLSIKVYKSFGLKTGYHLFH